MFLEFQRYRNFANLFSKFSKVLFTKKLVSFNLKFRIKVIRLTILREIP